MAESEVSEGWDPVKEVKQSAIEYMKSAGIRNVHDLDAEAIQYIGDENQINYEEVCKILGCKLPEELGPVDADDEIEEGEMCQTCHHNPCECDESVEESFTFESLYKKLAWLSEESTSEKDDKAEKAAKKVAKDIEYDEGHKGKDDDKAEKAGKKVKKDIEYDDKKDKKLDEWANDAGPGKTVSDTTFEQDIEFMTKVIAGGLNKPKSTGQTTIPVIAGQTSRMGVKESKQLNESITDWKKLAGI